jgi:hypothetical protein
MLLILAYAHDVGARVLADRWGSDAILLTGDCLRRARWYLEVSPDGDVRAELATATGTPVPVTGVVNRLGVVTMADLPGVHPDDQAYAAAELTAFLTAWLHACPVPVVNPPTTTALNGPAWYPERWVAAAVAVGLRAEVRRQVGGAPSTPDPAWAGARQAHVVGDTCLGDVHDVVRRKMVALARHARTPMLTATVSGDGPDAAARDFSVWPDLTDPAVTEAVTAVMAV